MITRARIPVMLLVVAGLFALTACAAQQLPPGYASLRTESTLLEVSGYIKGLREAYIAARQTGKMDASQFALAVKADQSLTAVWSQLLAAQKVKADSYALWAQVIQSTTVLEGLIAAWIPPDLATQKPPELGKKI